MLISSSNFFVLDSTRVALHDSQFKKLLIFSYTGPLCSPLVQSFSETGCFGFPCPLPPSLEVYSVLTGQF